MKGQWFLISAVIASGAFLTISFLFKSYFIADPAHVASANEDFYFHNIKQQAFHVINQSDCTDLAQLDKNFREFRAFVERGMGSLGYLVYMNYTMVDCPAKKYDLGLLLASERMIICQNVTTKHILPDAIEISCG